MDKSLRNFVIWFFVFIWFIFPMIGSMFSEEGDSFNDYARIVDMDYTARVVDEPNSQGKIVVTERFTFDVHAASRSNGFWELWRDLCEDYIDGLKVHYKVNSVKQILSNGMEISWDESDKLYWNDWDYVPGNTKYGPGKWYHSPGPYNEDYDRYECVFFYVNNLYREKITFEIEYEMYNAVLRYGDCADLYISLFSEDSVNYLESFNAEILIPDKDMPREGYYKVTTYGTDANSFPVEESKEKNPGYHTFSFNLDKNELKFSPYNEYIEIDIVSFGEDKHKFADYASVNDYYYDDCLDEIWAEQAYYENAPVIYGGAKAIILIACCFFSFITIFNSITKISRWKKKFPYYSTDDSDEIYRNIPSDLDPKFAAALVFCKDKKSEDDAGVYSSILLSLARKKYIELEEISANDVLIKVRSEQRPLKLSSQAEAGIQFGQPMDLFGMSDYVRQEEVVEELEPLTITEEHYLNLIKRHATSGSISMNNLQARIEADYTYSSNFAKKVEKSVIDNGVGLGYFQKANYMEPMKRLLSSSKKQSFMGFIFLIGVNLISYQTRIGFAYGGFALLGLSCLLCSMYLKKNAYKFVLLTEYGEQEYRKWRGLYNFLNSETLMNERTYIELPIWEKYLVYATAFGVSEKVIDAIKIRCPEVVAATSSSIVYNNYCRSGRIRTSGRRFHSSVRSASFSHSSGGSYGYGGGGRGGGGGGGGH